MTVQLTDEEKSKVRRHLGFPEVEQISSATFGLVVPLQGLFMVDTAMNHLSAPAAARVRQLIGLMDAMEQKMVQATCQIGVEQVGDIRLRSADAGKTTTDLLEKEYLRWAKRLADCLGVAFYPYSARFSGGMNVRVVR